MGPSLIFAGLHPVRVQYQDVTGLWEAAPLTSTNLPCHPKALMLFCLHSSLHLPLPLLTTCFMQQAPQHLLNYVTASIQNLKFETSQFMVTTTLRSSLLMTASLVWQNINPATFFSASFPNTLIFTIICKNLKNNKAEHEHSAHVLYNIYIQKQSFKKPPTTNGSSCILSTAAHRKAAVDCCSVGEQQQCPRGWDSMFTLTTADCVLHRGACAQVALTPFCWFTQVTKFDGIPN